MKTGYKAPKTAKIKADKAYFYVVGARPPIQRKGFVIKGNTVEMLPMPSDSGDKFILARFKGAKSTTAGMLRKEDLEENP
jgi:hypothetical protein